MGNEQFKTILYQYQFRLGKNAPQTLVGIYRPPLASVCALRKVCDLLSNYAQSEILIVVDLHLD